MNLLTVQLLMCEVGRLIIGNHGNRLRLYLMTISVLVQMLNLEVIATLRFHTMRRLSVITEL